LASGGASVDDTGKPVAYNASYFFYWLDRKGFNIPRDLQTPAEVEKINQEVQQEYQPDFW
jgi:hypothetical protein